MRGVVPTFILGLLAVRAVALKVDFSESAWRKSPIQKVVGLLKEMQAQIEKEAAEDEEMFEQMGCWCETNEREKTKAIELADQRITDLTSAIPEFAAKAAQLEVEIKQLKKEVAENTKGLNEAVEVRAKEQEEFRTNQKDMISSAASLKNAVRVMSKVQFTQKGARTQESFLEVQNIIRRHMERHEQIMGEKLSPRQHEVVMSFLQGGNSVMSLRKGAAKAPSSAIFGILKQMKEEFETNIPKAEAEEEEAVAKFKELKASKTEEIKAGEDQVETKTVEMADAKEKNAKSKVDLEETNASFKADKEFLMNLKLKCDDAQNEYDKRKKTRGEELTAVSETLAIITDDDNRETLSFMQTMSAMSRQERTQVVANRAATMIRKAASKTHNPRLMQLAISMRLDAFGKVIENIDKMVVALKAEQKEEVKQKDYCVGEFNSNAKQVAEKTDFQNDLNQQIADLTTKIESETEAVATLKGEIADMNTEMKKASENREKENHEFQLAVKDARATQDILKKAMDKLKSFYDKKAAALLQEQEDQEQPAQAEYKKSGAASGVMAMIETIIDEAKGIEEESTKGEADAQAAYESFMKDSTASIKAAQESVTSKTEELAKATAEKVQAEGDLKHAIEDLLSLGEYGQQLHKQCDFLVNNFNLRQESRTGEIEALNSAKAIFSGAKF
jgi:hypothetical protein